MVIMHQQERQLQLLRGRFNQWLPWLRQAVQARVTVAPLGQGNAFKLVAQWKDKTTDQELQHAKTYDSAMLLKAGHVRCVKDYAREFVHEVLTKRGVL